MAFKIFIFWSFVLLGRPQDLIVALQPLKPALLFTALSAGTSFFGARGREWFSVFQMSETKKYFLFYFMMILGIPFAYHRGVAFNFIFFIYLANVVFFLIFIIEVDSLKKLKTILFVICLCTVFYSVFGLMKGNFYEGRFDIYGNMFDPNDIAYVLVSLFPLSFYFILHREGFLKKTFAVISIIAAIIVILYSGSRGGMLGLITVMTSLLFTKTYRIKKSHKAMFVVAMVILSFLIRDKLNVDRYLTLANAGSDYNVSDEFGRVQIWKRAFDLLLSNPITGVGVNCFSMALGYTREELGILPTWQDTHNSYIQVAVEIGLPGFFFFIALIFKSLRNFSKLKKIEATSPEILELKTISGLIQVAFIGQLVTAIFLTQAYSLFFTLFFAFPAVLRNISVRSGNRDVSS